jgi:hypothetical protein
MSVLLTKYYSGYQIKKMRWAGNVASVGDKKVVYRNSMGGREGKRPLGRSRHR